jgi:hypothetical protein
MAKRGWDEQPADQYAELRETLAWKILFQFNPYPNALRLASGGDATAGTHDDEDYWLQITRGNEGPGMTWDHTPLNGPTTSYGVRRAARIPYLVKGESGGHFVDHLLVGYSERELLHGTPQIYPWGGPATQGNSAKPKYPNLADLGTFLIETLWPKDAGANKRVGGWDTAGGNYGYEESAVYGGSISPWAFRELDIKPEKSVKITVIGKKGGALTRWALLIGYEGGGAW